MLYTAGMDADMRSSVSFLLPAHLSGDAAQGMRPNEPIAQYELGSMRNFVYVVTDWKSREVALVDPQKDLSGILEDLQKNQLRLTRVLLTHSHHDHVAGVPEIAEKFPQVPIHVHEKDAHRLQKDTSARLNLKAVHDGEILMLGSLRVHVLHTPGHSAGECCYLIEGDPLYLLTGDTVFIRDCGRCDLPTGSVQEMFETLQRLKKLPPNTILLPGHHYTTECATTLQKELAESPPFLARSVEELSAIP